MAEVVKTTMFLILGVIVLIIVFFIIVEFFFDVKIGRGICKLIGLMIYKGSQYTGILSGLTEQGITSGCNLLPF